MNKPAASFEREHCLRTALAEVDRLQQERNGHKRGAALLAETAANKRWWQMKMRIAAGVIACVLLCALSATIATRISDVPWVPAFLGTLGILVGFSVVIALAGYAAGI